MKTNDKNERWPNLITLVKEGEKYLFAYDDASRKALLGVFGSFAKNPELNFSWHDAAVLSRKVRENEAKRLCGPRSRELRTG
jgi:hypothetical protein